VLFDRFLPPHDVRPGLDPFSTINEVLARLTEVGSSLSLLALPAFVWFSTRLFGGIRTSLNHIYDAWVRPKKMHPVKRFVLSKLRDLAMVFLVLILFLANVALTTGYSLLQAASIASGTGARRDGRTGSIAWCARSTSVGSPANGGRPVTTK